MGESFLRARLIAIKVAAAQLGSLFWPEHLSWDYAYNQIPMRVTAGNWLAVALFLALTVMAFWLRRRCPAASFFGFFFFFSLAPVSNVFVLIGTIRGGRLLYLPSLGFGAVAAIAVWWAAGKLAGAAVEQKRGLVQMTAASLLLFASVTALAVRARARSAVWADNFRLATEDEALTPGSYRSRYSAALARLTRAGAGDYDGVMRKVQEAIDILEPVRPALSMPLPYATMASLWLRKAKAPGAAAEQKTKAYEAALRYLERAETIDTARRNGRAAADLARGWRPDMLELTGDLEIYRNEIEILRALGRAPEAEQKAKIFLLVAPETPETHQAMARIQADLGRPGAASLEMFEEAELNDNHALDPAAGRLLMEANPGSCAAKPDGSVDEACPVVRKVRDEAHAKLMELLRLSGRADRVALWEKRRAEWLAGTAGGSSLAKPFPGG
jgi:tetratricopeptide (TPR) repeat protein